MTFEEKAIQKLIKTEKANLIKIANEINSLVLEHNFNRNSDLKYYIHYDISSAGNCVQVNVCDPNNGFNCLEYKEVNLLSNIFNDNYQLIDSIQRAKLDLIEMKKLVEKYIEINSKS
jgi:hypothetical protein